MSDYTTLAGIIRDRDEGRYNEFWSALMVCQDCPHRMIEHDLVAMRCRMVCRCDQRDRGLSSWADPRLLELGRALREVYGPPEPHNAPRASGTGLEAAVRPETPNDTPTRLSAAPDGAERR